MDTHKVGEDRASTTLRDIVTDQANQIGLVLRLHGLGVVIISVRCLRVLEA